MAASTFTLPKPKFVPPFDPEFVPAVLWNREYQRLVKANPKSEKLAVCLKRSNGAVSRRDTAILPHDTPANKKLNVRYVERLVKYMLWMYGGHAITIAGGKAVAAEIRKIYSPKGTRAFDYDFFSDVYDNPMTVTGCDYAKAPKSSEITVALGRNLDGVRIGFDLGGSDRKCAVVVDGKCVFSGETRWDPYFQADWHYQLAGIRDTFKQAMAHIPKGRKLDAIGGSAAGVYVDNRVRRASLFRGVQKANGGRLPKEVVNMFENVRKECKVPLITINDGEVTALLGSMQQKSNSVLGISMGTSVAGGYVTSKGNITDWLNELAFVPVDYREKNGPVDEWSGDAGCGVQYFCQQGVARLAKQAGLKFPEGMKDPEKLEKVQELMAKGDKTAKKIYESLGIMFGYSIAHFADFYDIKKLLILGRVTSGKGGNLLLDTAAKVLKAEFPAIAKKIGFCIPDEKEKRHGQAFAAATLPEIAKTQKAAVKAAKIVPAKKAIVAKKPAKDSCRCPGKKPGCGCPAKAAKAKKR